MSLFVDAKTAFISSQASASSNGTGSADLGLSLISNASTPQVEARLGLCSCFSMPENSMYHLSPPFGSYADRS